MFFYVYIYIYIYIYMYICIYTNTHVYIIQHLWPSVARMLDVGFLQESSPQPRNLVSNFNHLRTQRMPCNQRKKNAVQPTQKECRATNAQRMPCNQRTKNAVQPTHIIHRSCVNITGKELEKRRRTVHQALAHKLHEEKGRQMLDSRSQMALAPVTSGIIDGILPSGQLVAYPENNFEMMTATVRCCMLGFVSVLCNVVGVDV